MFLYFVVFQLQNYFVKFYSHVKTIDNKKHKIKKVLKSIEESDLCLIEVEGNYKHTAKISKKQPKIGDTIYNIAVPQGIQFKDSLPIFTGIFSGKYQTENQEESYLLSIPASQGSSGSPVFNQKGEIIGIIYAAFKNFSQLSISSTLDQVNILLRWSIIFSASILHSPSELKELEISW